jgi:hypothetical protein
MYKERIIKKGLFEKALTNYLRLRIENPYEYLKEKSKKNRLFYSDRPERNISIGYLEKLEPIIKSLNEIYGDNWDFLFYYGLVNGKIKVFFRGFITRFPQVTIENKDNKKYDGIKDLFVLYEMSANNGIPYCLNIQGGRTTMTFAEYYSYGHSHYDNIPHTNYCGFKDLALSSVYFSNFCLGTSNLSTMILETNEPENNNEEFWTNFFVQMFTIVYYESLSGMPYHKFSEIRLPTTSNNYSRASFDYAISDDDFLKYLFKDYKSKNVHIDLSLENNKLKVDFDEEFEKYAVDVLDEELDNYRKYYLCYKLEDNNYELHVNNTFNVSFKNYLPDSSIDIIPLVYKQKEFPLVITDIPKDNDTVTPKLVLMKETKEYIKRCLTRRLEKIQKNEAFESVYKNKINSYKRGLQRDNIPL